ncbi:MAG: DUF1800 family protein [Pyrinomonadaceae bacterium]
MDFRIQRVLRRSLAVALMATAVIGSAAQDDPDPNSPTPVLLSMPDSTRALAQRTKYSSRTDLTRIEPQAFHLDSRVVIFARNLQPAELEGANALRVYAEDAKGHQFRFPVIDVREVPRSKGAFAVTITLTDEIRFWDPPAADGDILIYLTWRGLASNRVRLGVGKMGGEIKDQPGSKPTPLFDAADNPEPRSATRIIAPAYVGYRWSGDRLRFLEQAAFGPNSTLDSRIQRIGLRSWLNEQFDAPYPSNPYPDNPLKPANAPSDCDNEQTIVPDIPVTCFRDTYSMYQPQTWFMKEAFYGDAQLRHRVAWSLAQIWVTSGVDVQQGRHMVEYHKILSRNAFGNYRTLMKEMTLNPTMGGYLDMAISTRNNPNENYAREIMQLFTVGLFMLNQDGTLQRDASNNPIPTYDQNGVNDLTKVLTGWSFCNVASSCPNLTPGTVDYIDPMLLNGGVTTITNNRHDLTAKTLLSYPGSTTTTINACTNCTTLPNVVTYANNSLEQAMDNIFNHPNVGPFVGKILIQHMVTSDPTPAYVARVAGVFNNNGFGVRGDMKAVIRAVLLDPEARGDAKTDPYFGKLREPVQLATNLFRTFNVRSANGTLLSDGYLTGRPEFTGMAQVPFLSPTVFNFYPPDYGVPGTTMLGPEFAILTTGTSIARANFVDRMVFNTIPVGAPNAPNGTSLDFNEMQALAAADPTGNRLVDELNQRMLHGTMSAAMKNTILTAVTNITSTNPLQRAKQAMYLVATSSQYQVQR